jgi:hypothetical protein
VHLTQSGTYKIALVNNTVFATWKDKGDPKTWRGTAEAFKAEVPPNAEELKTSRMSSRVEVFVRRASRARRRSSRLASGWSWRRLLTRTTSW